MKSEKLRRAIGEIDEDLIEAADKNVQKVSIPAWKKWGTAAAAFVVLAAAALWVSGVFSKAQLPAVQMPESAVSAQSSQSTGSAKTDELPSSSKPQSTSSRVNTASALYGDEEGLSEWYGKRWVTSRLQAALEEAQNDDIFAIRIHPVPDEDFLFEGKTLGQYYLEMAEEMNLPDKLLQLLKEGDDLKYGDKLWQEGNAEGIKWYKSLYEERVEFYGEALLAKYIVEGEFLKDQLEADVKTVMSADTATRAYERARDAWRESLCEAVCGVYPSELCEYDVNAIVAYFTKEDFAAFSHPEYPDFDEWSYDLALAFGDEEQVVIAVDPRTEAYYGADE